jgi:acylphosphatase
MHRKYYNVSVIGNVQDIGFRKFVESTAHSYHVTGYVFNDTKGSVKMRAQVRSNY